MFSRSPAISSYRPTIDLASDSDFSTEDSSPDETSGTNTGRTALYARISTQARLGALNAFQALGLDLVFYQEPVDTPTP
jgi:hypothetical protein